jgi:tryptophan synthase alpha chain
MSRLRTLLSKNRSTGTPSLGLFTTAGYPVGADTVSILEALVDGGADFVELGMPFSDPLAEGKTIQRSSEGALAAGMTLDKLFDMALAFRERRSTPLVLMGYVNPVFRYGVGNFFRRAQSCGVDAVILPDLPPEEAVPVLAEAKATAIDLIFLIAPTTPDERIRKIDNLSGGFLYAVSVTGLTGSHVDRSDGLVTYLDRARQLAPINPLLVGFGISSYADIQHLSAHADGCIVGSALIRKLEDLWNDDDLSASDRMHQIRTWVSELKLGPTRNTVINQIDEHHG